MFVASSVVAHRAPGMVIEIETDRAAEESMMTAVFDVVMKNVVTAWMGQDCVILIVSGVCGDVGFVDHPRHVSVTDVWNADGHHRHSLRDDGADASAPSPNSENPSHHSRRQP